MIPIPAGPITRILTDLASGFAWRLAKITWPPLSDWLKHHAYCHPEHGLVTWCQPHNGHCTTCKRPAPPRESRTPSAP